MPDYKCSRCGMARYGSVTGGSYDRHNGTIGMVNDGCDKCTDCLESEPAFHVGQTIAVKAWWQNGKPVQCEVVAFNREIKSLDVQPMAGNRHRRYVHSKDVIHQ